MKTVERMFDGSIDVVGDIHGQIDALRALLDRLGYSSDGTHADGNRLVFVGDLVDRGPDSVAVVKQVRDMVRAGNAQCVLGNHELNILRGSKKDDNNWFFDEPDRPINGQRVATASERCEVRDFLAGLPLALERDDLRVVHACWHADSIWRIDDATNGSRGVAEHYDRFRELTDARLESEGLLAQFIREESDFGAFVHYGSNDHKTHWPDPTMLPAHAAVHEARQMGNPIAVLTSGEERTASKPFAAGGKFRFVERVPWWNNYHDDQATIIGHYWRLVDMNIEKPPRATGVDLFVDSGPEQWFGAKRNVYCVDFSVGGRANGHSHETCRLAAVRWPEARVVFDNGDEMRTAFGH